MIYRREGMRHQCWSLVIVSTERGRQVGDEVLHHGLPRSRESPVYRRGHGESVFACASTLVRRGEYRAQTGIWRLLSFVSVRTIKGRSTGGESIFCIRGGRRAFTLGTLAHVTGRRHCAAVCLFEGNVFETRTQPRPPPVRPFDVPIVERPGSVPPARRPYPVAPHHQPELDRQVQALLDAGLIRRSRSEYSAPVLFTPKKDGKLRMVVDYRMLNAQTVRDRFPTPTAGDLIAKTRGAKLFSKIDLLSGFHQLRMNDADAHKTAFATPSGLYEFVSAPFGLTSVPGAFQRFMQFVLAEHIAAGYCVVYCDDIAIFSQSEDPLVHLQHLEAVLTSLRQHQLLAKGSKCEFMRREAEFLGFMVSGEGVRPMPSKIE
jgi:hypothetical protein